MTYLLVILLSGSPLANPIVIPTISGCLALGERMVSIVKQTEPERGANMTYRCDKVLQAN